MLKSIVNGGEISCYDRTSKRSIVEEELLSTDSSALSADYTEGSSV